MPDESGFTLVEVIAVMVVLSVLSLVVAGKGGFSIKNAENVSRFEVAKNHIRYAQGFAMGTGQVCGLRFNGLNYWMFTGGSTANRMKLPGESNDRVTLPSDLSAQGVTLSFDSWGRPFPNQGASGGTSAVSIALGSKTITVTRETGFVP